MAEITHRHLREWTSPLLCARELRNAGQRHLIAQALRGFSRTPMGRAHPLRTCRKRFLHNPLARSAADLEKRGYEYVQDILPEELPYAYWTLHCIDIDLPIFVPLLWSQHDAIAAAVTSGFVPKRHQKIYMLWT